MVSLILLGRIFFTFDNAKTALGALFLTDLRRWFQLRFLSKWTPSNLRSWLKGRGMSGSRVRSQALTNKLKYVVKKMVKTNILIKFQR